MNHDDDDGVNDNRDEDDVGDDVGLTFFYLHLNLCKPTYLDKKCWSISKSISCI